MGTLAIYDVPQFISRYGTKVFVETGTALGDGLDIVLPYDFDWLYSIEYMQEMYDHCLSKYERTEPRGRLTLIHNDSVSGLETILPNIGVDEPIFFWLDAHFPGGGITSEGWVEGSEDYLKSFDYMSEDESVHLPLKGELSAIRKLRPDSDDIFIIDDLRLFEDGSYEDSASPGSWERKIIDKYGGGGIGFIEDLFADTHTITRIFQHQGSLMIVPKDL
jgi:hypothetical protein